MKTAPRPKASSTLDAAASPPGFVIPVQCLLQVERRKAPFSSTNSLPALKQMSHQGDSKGPRTEKKGEATYVLIFLSQVSSSC